MEAITAVRTNPFSRLEDLLQRGDTIVEKKLKARTPADVVTSMATSPADEVDQAYGQAIAFLGTQQNGGLTQHALDPERVAQLLDL